MAFLWTTLCIVVMATAVLSKPVSSCTVVSTFNTTVGVQLDLTHLLLHTQICLSELPQSSESSEATSSEEADTNAVASPDSLQPPLTEPDVPAAVDETAALDPNALLPSADLGPSPVTLNTTNPEDPQASTDTDASQLVPGVDITGTRVQDLNNTLPDGDASRHPGKPQTGIIPDLGATAQPQVTPTTSGYQGFPQGATPPYRPHGVNPTPQPMATTPPLLFPLVTSLTGGPGRFRTHEPDPPRGDNM